MIITYIILMLVACSGLLVYLNFYTGVHRLLKTFITVAFIMWYVTPVILTISGQKFVLHFIGITDQYYYDIVLRELFFYFAIIFLFLLFYRSRKINFTRYRLKKYYFERRSDKIFFWITIIYIVIYCIFLFQNALNYKDNNSIENAEGGVLQILSFFASYILAFLWVFYIFGPSGRKRNVVLALLIVFSIIMLMSGSRIHLLGIIYLAYFIYMREENRVKKRRILAFTSVLLIAAVISLPYLSMMRTDSKKLEVDNSKIQELALEELNIKLNSFAYSSALVKYDGVGFAGLKPYVGSVLKFIPRVVWSEKPTPTSFNSKVTGIPSRRVPYLLGDTTDAFNVGVAPYTVAMWQMGLVTVVLSIILNVLLLFYVNRCFYHSSLYIKSLGFMMTLFPQLVMLPTFGDNIIQFGEQMLMFFVALVILGLVKLEYKKAS